MGIVTIGLDLGQRIDPTALAVVEADWRPRADGRRETHQVGTPVFDVLRASGVPALIVPVYFTHGDRRTPVETSGLYAVHLGKAYLVSRLQILLQDARLHLPRTPEAEVLAKELLEYEIHVDQDANDKYGAFKVGTHDDLVTALGLACQVDPPPPQPAERPVHTLQMFGAPGAAADARRERREAFFGRGR